jgi:hypothetical protein
VCTGTWCGEITKGEGVRAHAGWDRVLLIYDGPISAVVDKNNLR